MTPGQILILTLYAFLAGWVLPASWRNWLIVIGSLLVIYWLQPATTIRHLDFWFPTATITLTVFIWAVTQSETPKKIKNDLAVVAVISLVLLALTTTRYLEPLCCLTPSRPPLFTSVFIALAIITITVIAIFLHPGKRSLNTLFFILLIGLFVILKTDNFGQTASLVLRRFSGQDTHLANSLDLQWLGFSYLAFRLLHVLRDDHAGILPRFTLQEFIAYALFFPSFVSGPIDRSQRFIEEIRKFPTTRRLLNNIDFDNIIRGSQRILLGVFKKFVLADSLALISLTPQNALQINSSIWMWLLLYSYSLRIYFDFSGYTDIALGLGRLLGIQLPENFIAPYIKSNLIAFWNSWHITLAQWFRAYFFNPLTRFLRSSKNNLPVWLIILSGQVSTMLLIGLWHGINWNFALWGLWHGVGLFINNRWSEYYRSQGFNWHKHSKTHLALRVVGVVLTFHYVTLGWVWFALPNVSTSLKVMQTLLDL